jgi:hypothetical protein
METHVEIVKPEKDTLIQGGFTEEEIIELLWLRQWYQTGGSDRAALLHHWEFLKHLIKSGKLDL